MNEELVEALAQRLGSIKWPGLANPLNDTVADREIDASQGNQATWGDLARECLRQMEWIRQECDRVASAHWGGPKAPECGDPNACCVEAVRKNMQSEPLTLAPEDWQP